MALAHKDLLRQLDSLSTSFPSLGSRLSQAAKELQEGGIPLSDSLLDEVVGYCRNFTTARNQALELGKSLRQSSNTVSLQNIRDLVKAVEAVEGNAETRQQVLSLLDRLLGIVHQEQSNFAPLQPVYEQAKELKTALSQAAAAELPKAAIALAEGKHPLSALLTLVEQGKNLDDSQWETLEETVETAFSKQLAVAISRGKLIVKAIATTTNLAVAPSAQPETGFSLPITPPKVTVEALPEVIIIPSVSAKSSQAIKVDPDITILESPTSAVPIHEVIVVPSIELTPPLKAVTGQEIVFGQPKSAGTQTSIGLKVLAHIQGIGDRTFAAQEYAGSRGKNLRLEGFQININPAIPGLNMQYMAHVEGVGDTPWLNEGELAGFRGKAKRIEGFALRLIGAQAGNYDVFYTAHIQNIGDVPTVTNGQYCGTRGKALRIEGIKVWVQPKNVVVAKPQPTANVGLKVLAHIQSVGDRVFQAKEDAGSRGKGLRLEGFMIEIEPPIPGLTIQYMAHVEGVGDTPWLNQGQLAGFRGKSKRIEGFAIRLAGPESAKYDVFYTAHVQNVGDIPPITNGQYCGTRGKALRVESMKVWVQAK
jgi:uncharacterized protein YjdB